MQYTVALLLVGLQATAQTRIQPGVASKVYPDFSEMARRGGVSGTVLLRLTVGADGIARDPQVLRPLGYGLDEKAVDAVMHWKFSPAMKDGVAVEVPATIEMNFRSLSNKHQSLGPMVFTKEQGVIPPAITELDMPPFSSPGEATLEFNVTEQGDTENYKIISNLTSADQKLLLEAFRKWKFRPGTRDGVTVPLRGTVTYTVH